MANLQDFYEEFHGTKYRPGKISFHGDERGAHFASLIGTGKLVVDIGIRSGEVAAFYNEGNTLVGVDFDRNCLQLAAQNLGIETVHHDVSNPLPFPDEHCDVVVLAEIIEHLFLPEVLFKEAHRILRKGGRLIGSTPNAMFWKTRIKFLFGKFDEFIFSDEHIRQWSAASLTKSLRTAGFESVDIAVHETSKWIPARLAGAAAGRGLLFSGTKPV